MPRMWIRFLPELNCKRTRDTYKNMLDALDALRRYDYEAAERYASIARADSDSLERRIAASHLRDLARSRSKRQVDEFLVKDIRFPMYKPRTPVRIIEFKPKDQNKEGE